jgi:hypothetical protein
MWTINQAYIDGKFVTVSGKETIEIFNPATEQLIGTVTLASRADARAAIAAATRAQSMLAKTSKAERIEMLNRLESTFDVRILFAAPKKIAKSNTYVVPGSRTRFRWCYESLGFGSSFSLSAIRQSSATDAAFIFRIMLLRWTFTVVSVMPISPAICLFNRPSTT